MATNPPAWASFNTSTGRLYGTPGSADVGSYAGIIIRVSDGTTTVALAAFTITVTQVANGTATISWIPPTQNTDGTPLTDLGGYRIYYGTDPGSLEHRLDIPDRTITTRTVGGLTPGTWYFAVTAVGSDGSESAYSTVASKVIQ